MCRYESAAADDYADEDNIMSLTCHSHADMPQGQHERAVEYFRRSLRLNPSFLAAWTLMGHEYMEMKNTSAAIGDCGGIIVGRMGDECGG